MRCITVSYEQKQVTNSLFGKYGKKDTQQKFCAVGEDRSRDFVPVLVFSRDFVYPHQFGFPHLWQY